MEINTMNSLFFTNVHLLGLDESDMEGIYKIPFKKDMFTLPNKAGSEAILHFLFCRLNPTLSKEQFRDCWPLVDKTAELQFRKVCHNWLTQIQEEPDARFPRINASLFLTPGGRKFVHFLYSFSTYVLMQVMKTEHGWCNEVIYPNTASTTLIKTSIAAVNDYSSKECEEFFSNLHLLVAANRNWKHYASDLVKESRKLKKLLRESESEKKLLERQLQDIALKRLSESTTQKTTLDKSTSVTERYSKELVQRINMASQSWQYISALSESLKEKQDIVQSVIENRFSKYSLDAAAMGIRVPNILLRESSKMFLKLEVDNVYNGGCLNLVSTLLLWNVCLKMFKEHFQREKLPNFSTVLPLLTTQVHKHHCHLKATKELRDDVTKKTLPNLKHNIDVLKRSTCLETPSAIKNVHNLSLGLSTPTVKSKHSNSPTIVSLSESLIATSSQRHMTLSKNGVYSTSPLMEINHLNPLQVLSLPKMSTARSMKESKVPSVEIKLKGKERKPPAPSRHKTSERGIQKPVKEVHRPQKHFPPTDKANNSKHEIDDFLIEEVVQSVLNSTNSSLDGQSLTVDFGSSYSPLMLGELKEQTSLGMTPNLESFLAQSACKDVEQHDNTDMSHGHYGNKTLSLDSCNSDLQHTKLNDQDKVLFDSFQTSPLPKEMIQSELSKTLNESGTLKTFVPDSLFSTSEVLEFSEKKGAFGLQSELTVDKSPSRTVDVAPHELTVDKSYNSTRDVTQHELTVDKSYNSTRDVTQHELTVDKSYNSTIYVAQHELTVDKSYNSTRDLAQHELTVDKSYNSTRDLAQHELTVDKSYNSTRDVAQHDSDELLLSPRFTDRQLIDSLHFESDDNEQTEGLTKDCVILSKTADPDRGNSLQTIQEKLSALRQKASDILDISLDSSSDD